MKLTLEKDDLIELLEQALHKRIDRNAVSVKAKPFEVTLHNVRDLEDSERPEAVAPPESTPPAITPDDDDTSLDDVLKLNRRLMSGETTEFPS